jgi:hypothetical protein
MRQHAQLIIAVALVLTAVGCGSDETSSSSDAVADTVDAAVETVGDYEAGDTAGDGSADVTPVEIVETPELCDVDAPLVALPSSLDLWWWQGEPTPTETVSLLEAPEGCTFALDVSHPWLSAELVGDTVKITVHPGETSPGVASGEVRVIGTSAANATIIPVVARLWSAPIAGATPMALVVGLDGVRPDALAVAETPYMDLLVRGGASSMTAHTQLTGNTMSGPGWGSIMSGVDTDKHGVTSNDLGVMDQMSEDFPSFVRRAEELLGVTSAAIVNWVPVALLIPEGILETYELGSDLQVGGKASDSLRDQSHAVTFVHLDEVDGNGHGSGFSADNPLYIGAIEACDLYIGQMLNAILTRPTFAAEDWLIVLTTDHGGLGFGHGPMDADNQTIWLVAAGAGIPQQILGPEVSHMDVHPTVMAHLGVWPEESWDLDGSVVGVTPPEGE